MAKPTTMCGHDDCKYASGRTDNTIMCSYCEKTGHLRKCPADKDCDKYVKRRKPKRQGKK